MFNSFIFKYLSWTFCFYGFGEEEEKKKQISAQLLSQNVKYKSFCVGLFCCWGEEI